MVEVVHPGLYTTVQDSGRYGYQRYGMPVSGAMDLDAFRLANWLVGTKENPVLEMSITGVELLFKETMYVGITGGVIEVTLNGISVSMNRTVFVPKGGILKFGRIISGCRTYVSFSRLMKTSRFLNSSSTYELAFVGGVKGRRLKKGDCLFFEEPVEKQIEEKEVPEELIHTYTAALTVRVVRGPEYDFFEEEELASFFHTSYKISSSSNRMGYRMEGNKLKIKNNLEILSSAVLKGTIQVPKNGQPILLMSEAQTTGGYPRIANVITADIPYLAQQKAGDNIRFREITLEKAQVLFYNKEKKFQSLLNS